MKQLPLLFLRLPLLLTVICSCLIAQAQKLPKVQQISKRAPIDIKVDGKTTEWNDQFLAYNLNNRIYYTVSNDDNNLYLTLRASDEYANEKAIFGITFTIKIPVEKGSQSKESVSVVFPISILPSKLEPIRNSVEISRQLKNETSPAARKKIDSLRLFANTKMNDAFNVVNVKGIKEIQEPSISIDNQQGIQVAVQFDAPMQYVYELAIPLKYLGSLINGGQKFSYNIKMNGIPDVASNGVSTPRVDQIEGAVPTSLSMSHTYVSFPTDFSGGYTLAKSK